MEALNSVDYSTPSGLNSGGENAQVVPLSPASAPTRDSTSSQTQLVIDYALPTGTYTGGSTILSISLEWDSGTSGATWTSLVGVNPASLTQTYTITSGLTSGSTYKFRYRAQNIFGWGSYSAELSTLAAEVPQTMAAVVSTNSGSNVRFSWTALSSNGAAITAYKLEIMQGDWTYSEDSTNCNGADATIVTNQYCDVPMSVITASPYSHTAGETIHARVSA